MVHSVPRVRYCKRLHLEFCLINIDLRRTKNVGATGVQKGRVVVHLNQTSVSLSRSSDIEVSLLLLLSSTENTLLEN